MLTMKRNLKSFYVRHVDEAESITVYTEPELVQLNLFPTTADSDLVALGSEYIEYMRARISIDDAKKYDIGDLLYADDPVFNDMTDVGNATYRIRAILPMLNVSELLCKRMSGAT